MDYTIRKAQLEDREAIKRLIAASASGLSSGYYQQKQVEAAIASVFGVDTDLINDGTYFIAESDEGLVGSGGWSKRKALFGGDQFTAREEGMLDPLTDPAKIRAFFVHPAHARQGIARRILERCEKEASDCGFQSLELMATLPGVPFYAALGYTAADGYDLDLGKGVLLQLLRMRKRLVDI